MMDSRRDFIKKAALLSGGTGLFSNLPPSIQKALAINPATGSSYLDAEHIVILMQENRSFDHCYGALQGVRGFNDPRAIKQPDNNLVWLQKNAAGETYSPFRLNIKETKSTWTGSLPHSWNNQVDARNGGKMDKWIIAKPSGHKEFANAPLTMGYYDREDIPFYYSLADAFTICDQNFCSSLTGTTPNRLYLWSGTVRESHDANVHAHVRNGDTDYDREVKWKSFPERLEENGIPWKIYQNEISLESGFEGEEDDWLGNFTDNPIEWFSQYNVRFSSGYQNYLTKLSASLPKEIGELKIKADTATADDLKTIQKNIAAKEALLIKVGAEREKWSAARFDQLSAHEKNLHAKAFTINSTDPDYRKLEALSYDDNGIQREVKIPKGDVLHQFRQDVKQGKLPVISWLVAPSNFSDHPGSPWYGAWYVSEVMDILTKDPEVWKKTIFILCYDENDGYFDHVPPFVPPVAGKPGTGKVSAGIDASAEHVTWEQDKKFNPDEDEAEDIRESSIGLGFRVPLVIASPWSRGGAVCSEVFDHTSILQFMEVFLSKKFKKNIHEDNITSWRRTVCGDLTSVFKPYNGEKIKLPSFLQRTEHIESVHKAKFKRDPFGYRPLNENEISSINKEPGSSGILPRQEKGIRASCSLPYQLYADGKLNVSGKTFDMQFEAGNKVFGAQSAGSPFNVYAPGKYLAEHENGQRSFEPLRTWAYAVKAGDKLFDAWPLNEFDQEQYHLCVYGPNGFFREFKGNASDPSVDIQVGYTSEKKDAKKLSGNVDIILANHGKSSFDIEIKDNAYKG
ncbi:MAG: phospholipase C, phosphocholine-specific, partial [Flavitalea sp.]